MATAFMRTPGRGGGWKAGAALFLLAVLPAAAQIGGWEDDLMDEADLAALRERFLMAARDAGEKAGVALPLARVLTEEPARGQYAAGALAQAVAKTARTKVTVELQPGAVRFIVLGPPPLGSNLPKFDKPAQVGEELAHRRRAAQVIAEFARLAPEFGRQLFAPDVAFSVTIEMHPEFWRLQSSYLKSIGIVDVPPAQESSLPAIRARLVRLMGEIPPEARVRLQMGAPREAMIFQGGILMSTEPLPSEDTEWYYQSYVSITVKPENISREQSVLNLRVERVIRRRKGAQDFSPERTTILSTPVEDRLVRWLQQAMYAPPHSFSP